MTNHRPVEAHEHEPGAQLFHGNCHRCCEPWPCEVMRLRTENERLHALIAAGHTHEWHPVTSKAEWRTTKVIHAACIDCVGDKANAKWPAEEKTR